MKMYHKSGIEFFTPENRANSAETESENPIKIRLLCTKLQHITCHRFKMFYFRQIDLKHNAKFIAP